MQLLDMPAVRDSVRLVGKVAAELINPLGVNSPLEVGTAEVTADVHEGSARGPLLGRLAATFSPLVADVIAESGDADSTLVGSNQQNQRLLNEYNKHDNQYHKHDNQYNKGISGRHVNNFGDTPIDTTRLLETKPRGEGILRGARQPVEFDVDGIIHLTDKGVPMKDFVKKVMTSDKVELAFVDASADVETSSVFGELHLTELPMDRKTVLQGLDDLSGNRHIQLSDETQI